ncbi:MAG: CoA ester lyase [Candidatus Izimaplasma sp.]|nr:CoA ester lyase [Candidatus Izimaplasma bacterium]
MSRSFLFLPGNNPGSLQNLDIFNADSIIIDLEDSVTFDTKDEARDLVYHFLSKFMFKTPSIYLRINDISTPFFNDDIDVLDSLEFKGYVLPKATKESVISLSKKTDKSIIALLETPMSLVKSEAIISLKQVDAVLLGAEDLTTAMKIESTVSRQEITYVRSKLALECAAHETLFIDTPYTDKDDLAQLKNDCLQAKILGANAKSIIHPNHVDVVNTVFSPTTHQIANAKRILKKAETHQKGAFNLDGKMIDKPIINRAKNLIAQAKKYQLL